MVTVGTDVSAVAPVMTVTPTTERSFTTPVALPTDGQVRLGYPSLALGAKGQATVAATETGGTGEEVKCGQLKLEQSSDLANWTVCSPIARTDEAFKVVWFPRTAYATNDKLYTGFSSPYSDGKLAGVILWREP